jgi:hypothetical protein
LPEMGEKQLVEFRFFGVESSIENRFKTPRVNGVCFSSCFSLNHSQFIFRINLNNTSLVWPLITMIFDNNKVTNIHQTIMYFALCAPSFLLPN